MSSSDDSKGVAIGVALLLGYFFHYLISIFAAYGFLNVNKAEQKERAAKMYLFGGAAIISMRFTCTYSAIFAWLTFAALMFYHAPAVFFSPENRKRMHSLSYLAYTTLACAWWIGEVIYIYADY